MKKKQWQLFLLIGLVNTLTASYFNYRFGKDLEQINTLQEGTQTCFMRTSQTLTSRLLNETNSDYLKKEFFNGTEECFGEIGTQFNQSFLSYRTDLSIKVNSWSSEVHWYHQKINGPSNIVQEKFEKIEEYKDSVFETLDKAKNDIHAQASMVNQWLVVSLILWGVGSLMLFVRLLRDRLQFNSIEEDVKSEMREKSVNHQFVENVMHKIVDTLELKNTQTLFDKYKDDFSEKRALSEVLTRNLTDLKPIEHVKREVKEVMPTLIVENQNEGVNLQNVVSKTIDLMSPQIFKYGILIDLAVPNGLVVEGEQENIEQIVYILINESLQSFSYLGKSGKITVKAQSLGSTIILDYTDNSLGFDNEILKSVKDSDAKALGTNLFICEELVKNLNGEILFDNLYDDKREIVGVNIKVMMRRGNELTPETVERSPEVVSIVRGKKSEVAAKLKEFTL